jgi:hypothetical protein
LAIAEGQPLIIAIVHIKIVSFILQTDLYVHTLNSIPLKKQVLNLQLARFESLREHARSELQARLDARVLRH